MSEATKKGEVALRDRAALHQQRRLKQATLFTHKDSADLLPLDGLKRLGTTKDLQPHSIVQRRLMEGNAPRLRREACDASAALTRSPLADHKDGGGGGGGGGGGDGEEQRSESTADDSTEERESPEESERSLRTDEEEEEEEEETAERAPDPAETGEGTASPPPLAALVVQCKCRDGDIRASIDTGCQHNHISSFYCRRLGLVPEQDSAGPTVKGLQLQLGTQRIQCSAYVKDDEVSELCLGLQTLLELNCCVDLSGRVLRLQGSGEELPFQVPVASSRCRHDTNKNL